MTGLLRRLGIGICSLIYKTIPDIYSMFFTFANARFLSEDIINNVSKNIYVLVSVIMLFAFSVTILSAIVNPDLLNDNKKGVPAVFKRAIVGLLLIVLVPLLFDSAFDIQYEIMSNGLIEKVVVGVSYDDPELGGNGGQVIAGTLIHSIVYPINDDIEINRDIGNLYKDMIVKDIDYIEDFEEYINITLDGDKNEWYAGKNSDFAFKFNFLVGLIAGGACCYMLLLFAIDTAVRMVKLAFLELTAPISIVSYIAVGDDVLKKWYKEVGKTYVDVFVRIVAMSFYILLISYLDEFMENIKLDIDGGLLTKVVLIVGLLIFVKQIPEFINGIFGTNIQSKGGISGRLGQMTGVGDVAKNAWNKMKKGALGVAGAATLGAGSMLGAGVKGIGKGVDNLTGNRISQKLKQTGSKISSGASAIKNKVGNNKAVASVLSAASVGASMVKGASTNGVKGMVEGYKNSNVVKARKADKLLNKHDEMWNESDVDSKTGHVKGKNGQPATLSETVSSFNKGIAGAKRGNVPSRFSLDAENKSRAELKHELAKDIESKNQGILDKFTALESVVPSSVAGELSSIKDLYGGGKISFKETVSSLKQMVSNGKLDAGQVNPIIRDINKLSNDIQDKEVDVSKLLNADGNIEVKLTKNYSKDTKRELDYINKKWDEDKKNASDKEKEMMENYEALMQDIITDRVGTASDNRNATNTPQFSPATNNTSSTTQNSNTSNNGATNSGSTASSTSTGGNSSINNSEYTNYSDQELKTRLDNISPISDNNDYFGPNPEYYKIQSELANRYANTHSKKSDTTTTQTNTTTNTTVVNNTNNNETNTNTNSQNTPNTGQSVPDMSSYFDNLSQTIKDTNNATNDILNKQLNKQDDIAKSTQQGFSNLNSTLNDGFRSVDNNLKKTNESLNNINESVDNVNSNIKRDKNDNE